MSTYSLASSNITSPNCGTRTEVGIKKMGVAHKESPNHANVSRVTAGIVGQLFLTSLRRKAQAGHPKNTIGMIYMPIMIE